MSATKQPAATDTGKFVVRAVGEVGATPSAALVVMGDRLGLYRAMAGAGGLTPAGLPASTFMGADYHEGSIATARQRAAMAGVGSRVRFEIAAAFSTLLCTPASLSQETGLALGAQAGESRIGDVVTRAGLNHVRRVGSIAAPRLRRVLVRPQPTAASLNGRFP